MQIVHIKHHLCHVPNPENAQPNREVSDAWFPEGKRRRTVRLASDEEPPEEAPAEAPEPRPGPPEDKDSSDDDIAPDSKRYDAHDT